MADAAADSSRGDSRRFGARRADLLEVVRSVRHGISIKDLATRTGVHENTVRFHLDRLLSEGLIERRHAPSGGPGRPPLLFVARTDAGRDNYELMARVLAGQLAAQGGDPGEFARQAGLAWGRSQALEQPVREAEQPVWEAEQPVPGAEQQMSGTAHEVRGMDSLPAGIREAGWRTALDRLARTLARAGFAPEVNVEAEPDTARVSVHHCPFVALVREDQVVPCGVHLGLMEGVLKAAGAPATIDLQPFATETTCVAVLTRQQTS